MCLFAGEKQILSIFFIHQLLAEGHPIHLINIGGGLGIGDKQYNTEPPRPTDLVEIVAPLVKNTDYTLLVEPGRSIVGNAGT